LASTLTDDDAFSSCSQRVSNHSVAMQHRDRFIEPSLRGDNRPVRTPQHTEPKGHDQPA
jgi:hypothetical protein